MTINITPGTGLYYRIKTTSRTIVVFAMTRNRAIELAADSELCRTNEVEILEISKEKLF